MFYLQALGRPVSSFQSLHMIFDCCTISCFSPFMSPGIFVCFKIKWISFLICHLFFLLWTCRICYKKRKEIKNHLFDSTLYDRHKCVIYMAWRGTNHSLIPHNHVSYAVSSPVRQYASSISYATASHTTWMVTRPVWWDVRFIVTLWTPFSSFIHSFNQISWVWFVGDVFLSLP